MEITITLKDTEDGEVEIEETRLPYSGENSQSLTTASLLADELRKKVEEMGSVEETACGIPYMDDGETEWDEM